MGWFLGSPTALPGAFFWGLCDFIYPGEQLSPKWLTPRTLQKPRSLERVESRKAFLVRVSTSRKKQSYSFRIVGGAGKMQRAATVLIQGICAGSCRQQQLHGFVVSEESSNSQNPGLSGQLFLKRDAKLRCHGVRRHLASSHDDNIMTLERLL